MVIDESVAAKFLGGAQPPYYDFWGVGSAPPPPPYSTPMICDVTNGVSMFVLPIFSVEFSSISHIQITMWIFEMIVSPNKPA